MEFRRGDGRIMCVSCNSEFVRQGDSIVLKAGKENASATSAAASVAPAASATPSSQQSEASSQPPARSAQPAAASAAAKQATSSSSSAAVASAIAAAAAATKAPFKQTNGLDESQDYEDGETAFPHFYGSAVDMEADEDWRPPTEEEKRQMEAARRRADAASAVLGEKLLLGWIMYGFCAFRILYYVPKDCRNVPSARLHGWKQSTSLSYGKTALTECCVGAADEGAQVSADLLRQLLQLVRQRRVRAPPPSSFVACG